MDNVDFWKILRVLTINGCNYKCTFCHNEGQPKQTSIQKLRFSDFQLIVDSLKDSSLCEIHFSGGEPFLNSETLKMIQYADEKTSLEIGCATNLSLVTDEIMNELSKTRVKLNIQFPSTNANKFSRITCNGNYDTIFIKLLKLKDYCIPFGLNFVIQKGDQNGINEIIQFTLKNGFNLKLLPDLDSKNGNGYKKIISSIIDNYDNVYTDKGTGAVKWFVEMNEKTSSIMYIDFPCFYQDIETCKKFAEIRLQPDLDLQTCIKSGGNTTHLDLSVSKIEIHKQFKEAWRNFTSC